METVIRKTVPLMLSLLSASNPQLSILDTLSKYSHDNDLQVMLNAIFAMGLIGARSNNAWLAQMFRQLEDYYHKEALLLHDVDSAGSCPHGEGHNRHQPFLQQLPDHEPHCGCRAAGHSDSFHRFEGL